MKACFINTPHRDFTQLDTAPALDFLYIMAAVRSAGHDVTFMQRPLPKKKVLRARRILIPAKIHGTRRPAPRFSLQD